MGLIQLGADTWAHPRVSGENKRANWPPGGGYGSSPRERGKLACQLIYRCASGLIPA